MSVKVAAAQARADRAAIAVLEDAAVAVGFEAVVFVRTHVVFVVASDYELLAVLDLVYVEVLLLNLSAEQVGFKSWVIALKKLRN